MSIPLATAGLCLSCEHVNEMASERCPHCGELANWLGLARLLNPMPEIGRITYVCKLEDCDA